MPLISLVGLPGCGKSTIGRHIAQSFDLVFVDSDLEIEKRIGESIRQFFEREGEKRFREIEAAVIAELCMGSDSVVATGGGAVLRAGNRQILRDASTVVYLRVEPEVLVRRLRNDRHRPLLQVADPAQKVRDLHRERDSLYREAAHVVVEPGVSSARAFAEKVVTDLEHSGRIGVSRSESFASQIRRP